MVQRAEKSYKQVALCIFLRMRNTSNQLFPKRSDEREFPYHRGNESEGKDGGGRGTNAPKVRSSPLPFDVVAVVVTFLLLLSLLLLPHLAFRHEHFRPEVISYLHAGAKNSGGKVGRARFTPV